MSDHTCDKAPEIARNRQDIAGLVAKGEEMETRVIEMETTLYGPERNGGGFLKDTRDTIEVMRAGFATMDTRWHKVDADIQQLTDRSSGIREIIKVSVPPILVGAASIITVLLTRVVP